MFKNKNSKKPKNHLIWLLFLVCGGFIYFIIIELIRGKDTAVRHEHRIRQFLKAEKKEVEELLSHKENLEKFVNDSCSLFKMYIIPHDCNDHKPKILRAKSLLTIAFALFVMKMALVGYLFLAYPEGAKMSEDLINKVLILVNQDREKNNLCDLSMNPSLKASAQKKADDLIGKGYFSHTSPDGRKPWDFIDRGQYRYLFVGENLAMNFSTAASVHNALMNSPSHKKNILHDRYEDIGIAMAVGMIDGKKTNVLVQFFGTTKTATELAQVDAETQEPAPVEEPEPTVIEQIKVAGEAQKTEDANIPEIKPQKTEPVEDPKIEPKEAVYQEQEMPEAQKFTSQADESKDDIDVNMEEMEAVEQKLIADNRLENISPNIELENNQITEVMQIRSLDDSKMHTTRQIIRVVNYIFITMLALMICALAINIIIRIRVQHKPIIIQTLALIVFISGLLYFKLHILESGIIEILIL